MLGRYAAAATANKCVHGAPGVSFVIVKNEALTKPSGATSVYLDLMKHAAEQKLAEVDARIGELARIRAGLEVLVASCPGHGALAGCPILHALAEEVP